MDGWMGKALDFRNRSRIWNGWSVKTTGLGPATLSMLAGVLGGIGCGVPHGWIYASVGLLLGCESVIASARRGAARAAFAATAFEAGWQVASMWWVVLAVRPDGVTGGLWQLLVITCACLIPVAWLQLAWLPLWWAARRISQAQEPSWTLCATAWWLARGCAATLTQIGTLTCPYGDVGVALGQAEGVAHWLPWIGAQGVGWAATGLACALVLARRRFREAAHARCAIFTVAGAAAAVLVGALMPPGPVGAAPMAATDVRLMALQPRIARTGVWSMAERDRALARLAGAVRAAPRGSILATPESYLLQAAPAQPYGVWGDLVALAAARRVSLIVGMPWALRDPQGVHRLNAALEVSQGRSWLYAKERLVPGGEYLPAPQVLGPLYRALLDGQDEGEVPAPVELTGPLYAEGSQLGVSICNEQAFALTMAQRAHDANVLLNLAFDGWLPSRMYRNQMRSIARVRAMEFGRPLLRVADDGASVLFDPVGRELHPVAASGDWALFPSISAWSGQTPYADAATWLAVAPLGAALLFVLRPLASIPRVFPLRRSSA
jgi:apolipoprotein N-acyltransferase